MEKQHFCAFVIYSNKQVLMKAAVSWMLLIMSNYLSPSLEENDLCLRSGFESSTYVTSKSPFSQKDLCDVTKGSITSIMSPFCVSRKQEAGGSKHRAKHSVFRWFTKSGWIDDTAEWNVETIEKYESICIKYGNIKGSLNSDVKRDV